MMIQKLIGLMRKSSSSPQPSPSARASVAPKKTIPIDELLCKCGAMLVYDQVNDKFYCKNCHREKR
jgi:hypothetical protein